MKKMLIKQYMQMTAKSEDNHGYGLKVIKSMAKKCGGNIHIEPAPTDFAVTVIIPCEVAHD